MPETLRTLRLARKYIQTFSPEEAIEEAAKLGLSPDEELFMWYGDDPAAFIRDMFLWEPDEGPEPYQVDIMQRLPRFKRVSVRGPHGLGKTFVASGLLLHFAETRDGLVDWKVITTASADRQLTKFFWPEVHKWTRKLNWKRLGREPYSRQYELLSYSLRLRTGEAFKASSDEPALIEGAHATQLMYVFDESKKIPGPTFDAAEGAFSNAGKETENEAYALAMSTPGPPAGRFFEIQSKKPGFEDWNVRPVTLAEVIACNRISREWADQRANQWGRHSAIYINRVEGNFAAEDAYSVIPSAWVEDAMDRWHEIFAWRRDRPPAWRLMRSEQPPLTAIGVDVALGGLDETVFAPRYGHYVRMLHVEPYMDNTKRIAELVMDFKRKMGGILLPVSINVDANGPGAGVFDHLNDEIKGVNAYKGSKKTFFVDKSGQLRFKNTRSAAYWNMRELLDPLSGYDVALPPDEELLGQLSSPTYREVGQGEVQVESKESLMKPDRLGKSPDKADAVIMAFWEDFVAPRARPRVARIGV